VAAQVTLSAGMGGSAARHAGSRNGEAASYIVPSRRTRDDGSARHVVGGNERHHRTPYVMPSVYEACTVSNNVRCFVYRTLRRG
jgi:hypothetical protein